MSGIDLTNVYDPATLMAKPQAVHYLFQLLRERDGLAAVNISHQMLPGFDEHTRFIDGKPYRNWYLIQPLGEPDANANGMQPVLPPVGACYLTRRNEVGIFVGLAHRRKGYARQALLKLFATHRPLDAIPGERRAVWLANINPDNAASIALFKQLGGSHIQNTYLVPSIN